MKVYFALIEMTNGEYAVEFNFENESLRHQIDNTMRTNMFEVGSNTLTLPVSYRNGSIESLKTNLRLRVCCILVLNLNTLVQWMKRVK